MTTDFLGALGSFLKNPLSPAESRRRVVSHLRDRDASTLRLFRHAVYADERSPYLQLLRHAGITYADIEELVRTEGVEGSLQRLHLAGVHLTLDEFKGKRAIRRGSLEIAASPDAFDNRTLSAHFAARTGGSRSPGRGLLIDVDLLAHEACYESIALGQFGLTDRPRALWRPVPPGTAGIKMLLRSAKAGLPVRRWFSQNPVWSREEWRHSVFTAATMLASRVAGRGLARPIHVPLAEVLTIVRWLAAAKAEGRPGVLDTNAASAVRVCRTASDHRIDISGSFFRVGGEPYTAGKAAAIERAGCRATSYYSMAEVGRIANSCADPAALDDAHVATDKVAILASDVRPAGADRPVSALFLTAFHASTPKIMINVEMGDYATLSTRPCGCAWHDLGLSLHLRDIRSYEKLTAEGMHFVGADLLTLLEETLPARFGGSATDYQLVEREDRGVPTITLLVSPRVTGIDEAQLRNAVVDLIGANNAAARMMASRWREAGTLRIAREEPQATSAGKVLALHIPQSKSRHDA
jgi:hypothetical protein